MCVKLICTLYAFSGWVLLIILFKFFIYSLRIYPPGILFTQGRVFKYLTIIVGVLFFLMVLPSDYQEALKATDLLCGDNPLPLQSREQNTQTGQAGSQGEEPRKGLGYTCPVPLPISPIRSVLLRLELASGQLEAC